ncbi:MAG: tannase/feruloyl esterase family alpha/beta hydrolase [Burkholderiaceae bacterium]
MSPTRPDKALPDGLAACTALNAPILADAIGLPSSGAIIESATLVGPETLSMNPHPPFSPAPPDIAVIPAHPEFCKVLGSILPVDSSALPIRFEVNLPTEWNNRYLQFGGGGFNGVLITGLGLPPSARPDLPSPLGRGFVTAGTDSGHSVQSGVPIQAFALNPETLENFAFASYKKVHDVALVLITRRYGREPSRRYFMGSSEGGREALTMAQRFPTDFEGIFARVPVINWTGLQMAGTRIGIAQMNGGWLGPEATRVVAESVRSQCDAADGLVDGVISDYDGCKKRFVASQMRCRGTTSTGCLTDAQMAAFESMHSPLEYPNVFAHSATHYPGWELGGEDAQGTGAVGGWVSWQSGGAAPTVPPGPQSSRAWLYGSGAIQYFVAQSAEFDPSNFDPHRFTSRLSEISALMDSTDPDLERFAQHGGRLIVSEHLADYAQSPYAGIEYVKSVQARLGAEATDVFMRLYVTPGADHMGMGAASSVDILSVLMTWVEDGKAPGDLVQARLEATPPFAVIATRPMCRYPGYPHYRGSDPDRASSFVCAETLKP